MKIRNDFVTNSSSSNYVTLSIKCDMIENFLNSKGITLEILEDFFTIDTQNPEVVGNINCSNGPAQAIVNWIDRFFSSIDFEEYLEYKWEEIYWDDEDEFKNSELSPEEFYKVLLEFKQFLLKNSQEINKTIEVWIKQEMKAEGGADDFFGFMRYQFKDGKGKYARLCVAEGDDWNPYGSGINIQLVGDFFREGDDWNPYGSGSTKLFVNWDELSDEDRDCIFNYYGRSPDFSDVDEKLINILKRIAIYQEFDLYENN